MVKGIHKSVLVFALLFIVLMALSTIYGMRYMDIGGIIEGIKALPYLVKFLAMTGLIILQTVLAFLPGEPFELASGYIFGSWQGTIICILGSCVGTAIIYLIVKLFKNSIINVMFEIKKVEKVKSFFASKKSMFWTFILFLVPGTPKDIMTYVVSLGKINLISWLVLTTVGRIPSIVTSTFLSGSIKEGNIPGALIILIVTIILAVGGGLLYKNLINPSNNNGNIK
ncbi:TVP38/TMEM64 family protein [Alloiococcus sp. CFN-8]|uniref:TVP38/TMEM64 family protein n=1 Tax=Alloiococcus sp. CFN-8 TaxID=3416081 RepID=UPI003CED74B2